MRESIHIVGGGIAGLSAGCYAQMNGYQSRIFEMHSLPGGLCTAWQRNGYTIDGCIHWLAGSSPKNRFYRLWEEVGAVPNRPIFDHDVFARIEGDSGQALTLYTDVDRLADHLLELAPEDRDVLREWTRGLRRLTRLNLPIDRPAELVGPIGKLGMAMRSLPHMGVFRRWAGTTVRQFAEDLDNPFLREAFPFTFDLPDFPMIAMMMTLAGMHNRASGYPLGGSLPFARSIEHRYLDLGGKIEYGARVEEILVEGDRAIGVRLTDGTEHRSNLVISAADGHATILSFSVVATATRRSEGTTSSYRSSPRSCSWGSGWTEPSTISQTRSRGSVFPFVSRSPSMAGSWRGCPCRRTRSILRSLLQGKPC
jgi:phytoene dehydrogenase-like protein